jgi:two-component system chemotaxis response regulator CheY
MNESSRSMPILVVDDDPDLRETMQDILEMEGWTVRLASNGKEALEVLRQFGKPCLILLDMMMPVMTGEEFLEHVQQDPVLNTYPVIICSATSRSTLPGARSIIRKPFMAEDLLASVAAHCGSP